MWELSWFLCVCKVLLTTLDLLSPWYNCPGWLGIKKIKKTVTYLDCSRDSCAPCGRFPTPHHSFCHVGMSFSCTSHWSILVRVVELPYFCIKVQAFCDNCIDEYAGTIPQPPLNKRRIYFGLNLPHSWILFSIQAIESDRHQTDILLCLPRFPSFQKIFL